jgi:hypothetical protein
MDKLLELLLKNPIIAIFVVIWIAGSVGNVLKAKKRAETARRRRPGPAPSPQQLAPQPAPVSRPGPATSRGRLANSQAQTPEEIAREMRRILGLEDAPPPPKPAAAPPPPEPPAPPRLRPALASLKDDTDRYSSRVDPHVGERIRDRHMAATKVGQPSRGRGAIGNLGGRVAKKVQTRREGSRYAMEDLRKAIVINEILSPPVGLRDFGDRRPG